MQIIRVKNQFKFSRDTGTACMPISILAIFHLYSQRERLLDDDDWTLVMQNGGRLWLKWHAMYGHKHTYPAADEVLSLKECKKFVELFGDTPKEYCEWAANTEYGDKLRGSLISMFQDVEKYVTVERKNVACLITLPPVSCISVSSFRPNEYQYFDSHGNGFSDYCDFAIYSDYTQVIRKIFTRYKLTELEKNSFCSYSAMLFVK